LHAQAIVKLKRKGYQGLSRWLASRAMVRVGWRSNGAGCGAFVRKEHGLIRLMIGLAAALVPAFSAAEEARPRSMLVLDQSDVRAPFYYEVFSRLRAVVNAGSGPPVTIYAESLDLNRFNGPGYEEGLQRHFQSKYRDKPIGVVVPIGSAALDYAMRQRAALWPDVPVAFAMVDEPTAVRLHPPPDVTGSLMKLRFADMMMAARAVVPDLKHVAFVGDPWETQTVYRHWREEIPPTTRGLDIIDLTGLRMGEVRRRVASLPDHTAILYTGIYSDGERTFYVPANALTLIAESANRPIVITAESELGRGGIGGSLIRPALIGEAAGKLAMRILDGESATSIPAAPGDFVQPIYDWRQMQKWNVSEASLPPGSEIRFRVPTASERYRRQIIAVSVVVLFQTCLIAGLLYERRRRRKAEVESRQRMAELAHMNRHATAGEMSASLAHELNQPLAAILSNAEVAEDLLRSSSPSLPEIVEILADIRRDDQRATEVIKRLRSFLKKTSFEAVDFDLNETVREVFDFLAAQAAARNVTLSRVLAAQPLLVRGDRIQVQQVFLNLIVNGMDATAGVPAGQRRVAGRIVQPDSSNVEVCICDSGPGILLDDLACVFEPFFTTKKQGMGMGLSIARTIVEAHRGQIWAENQAGGSAMFCVRLPLAMSH
jgi:signal transduction histidine kinase